MAVSVCRPSPRPALQGAGAIRRAPAMTVQPRLAELAARAPASTRHVTAASAVALTGAPRTHHATATVTHRQLHGQQSSASLDREAARPVIKQPQQPAAGQQQQARRQSPHRPPRVDPRSHACGTVTRLDAAGRHSVRAKTRRLSPAQGLAHGPALECHGDYTLTGPARLVKRGSQLLAFLESGGSARLWYHSEAIHVQDHDLRRSHSSTSMPRRSSPHASNAGNNVVPAAALNSARSPVAAPSPAAQTPCVLAGRLMELHGDVELAFSQGVIHRPDKVVLNAHAIPDGATIQLPAGACIMHPLIL